MNIIIEGPQGCGKTRTVYDLVNTFGIGTTMTEVFGLAGAKQLMKESSNVMPLLNVLIVDDLIEGEKEELNKLSHPLRSRFGRKLIIISIIQKSL